MNRPQLTNLGGRIAVPPKAFMEQVDVAAQLYARIQEVVSWNLGRNIGYSD
jgi:hypothetical protein